MKKMKIIMELVGEDDGNDDGGVNNYGIRM